MTCKCCEQEYTQIRGNQKYCRERQSCLRFANSYYAHNCYRKKQGMKPLTLEQYKSKFYKYQSTSHCLICGSDIPDGQKQCKECLKQRRLEAV